MVSGPGMVVDSVVYVVVSVEGVYPVCELVTSVPAVVVNTVEGCVVVEVN